MRVVFLPAVRAPAALANRTHGRILLLAVLITAAALRLWLAFTDDGIYWPDEIYESLEPAHRLVFGYGLIAWEFVFGARNWALPGLLAGIFKVCALAGFTDPREYLTVIRTVLCAAGVGTAYGSYRLARRHGVPASLSACGASFFGLVAPAVYFGPKALSEPVSALPIVFGFALALPSQATRADRMFGASLLGFATLLRMHNALFCVALFVVWAARRRWKESGEVAAVLLLWALILGGVDRLTWGEWFRSVNVYMRFTFALSGGPITGSSPASYYVDLLFASMPLATIVVGLLCFIGAARARALAFVIAIFLLAHVLSPNKAYRYILAAFPLMGALSAVGLQVIWEKRPRAGLVAAAALLLAATGSAATFQRLTFREIGPFEKTRPTESAYDDRGGINRLLMTASRQPDICGLRIETDQLAWIGGHTYFHRNAPLYPPTGPPPESGVYNYVIATVKETAGNPVAADGEYVLRRLSSAPCRSDASYDPRLPGWQDIGQALGVSSAGQR